MSKASGLRILKLIGLISLLAASMHASAGFFGFGGDSWKEEVLLHDGQKLIVERSQSYGGRHEIGQPSPVKEESISFILPNTNKSIVWTEEINNEPGSASLGLLAIDVVHGTPYMVTVPVGCTSFNKWGRPNPPYVIFKYEGQAWEKIPLNELPLEIKEANVISNVQDHGHELNSHSGVVSASEIKEINGFYRQEVLHLKVFVRTPFDSLDQGCPVLVRIKGGWQSAGGAKAPFPITTPNSPDEFQRLIPVVPPQSSDEKKN
ncbi:hypothetical protein [Collimonas pratensis]|uniref:Uncharacterized protein n=1 Tax=Collimonas pratensis TaxID=279113 RepID=A0A127Q931_9BURK|nr:hypothetical protein [Collimonas pratensis]AMP06365.1 hypothetical protein CPter91_4045 [Collimonas pratensis]